MADNPIGNRRKLQLLTALAKASTSLVISRKPRTVFISTFEDIGRSLGVTRVALFELSDSKSIVRSTIEWTLPEEQSLLQDRQNFAVQTLKYYLKRLQDNKMIKVPDSNCLHDREREFLTQNHIRSLLTLPTYVSGDLYGVLSFEDARQPRNWADDEVVILQTFANIISGSLEREQDDQQRDFMATHDALTGLLNRYMLEEQMKELEHDNRHPISLMICDIDGLKQVNDNLGHAVGDKLLQETAEKLRDTFEHSTTDAKIARIGGDEFGILLPETSYTDAAQLTSKLSSFTYSHDNIGNRVSLSIGIGTATSHKQSLEEVFRIADQRMYAKKHHRKHTSVLLTDILMLITAIMNIEEPAKANHGLRSCVIANIVAKQIVPEECNLITLAALLHDIGLIGVPEAMLNGESLKDVSAERLPLVCSHPYRSSSLVKLLFKDERVLRYILEHHEQPDGLGYPRGLKSNQISMGGHILRAAEWFEVYFRKHCKCTAHHCTTENIRMCTKHIIDARGKELHGDVADMLLACIQSRVCSRLENEVVELQAKATLWQLQLPGLSDITLSSFCNFLTMLIDSKHPYTRQHSERVAEIAKIIGARLELSYSQLLDVQKAGLVHDIGKIALPNELLEKPEQLTDEEQREIRRHPLVTYKLLASFSSFNHIAWSAATHHERTDGTGYPFGVAGNNIPLLGRILAIADSIDAMSHDRSYRSALTPDRIALEIRNSSGTKYDSEIVKAIDDTECWHTIFTKVGPRNL